MSDRTVLKSQILALCRELSMTLRSARRDELNYLARIVETVGSIVEGM